MKKLPIMIGLLFSLVLSLSSTSLAQDATGKIFGTVTDPQGGAISGARVVVTNVGTQISQETTTDKDGNYQVILLPLGKYQVSAEAEGFKKAVSGDETLRINQSLLTNLKMEVGENSELVEINSQETLIETVNPTLGQSVTARPIVNMPLNGRDVLDLATLQPGVTPSNDDNGGAGNFSIAGGRTDSVTFLLDGGINNDLLDNGVVLNPNPDTIEEFRILTSNYTAEYGRNGGGIISVVTKSGTNQFHGSAFEFIRNDALNATSFFNKRDGLPKDVLKRNQFGFTVGGPITVPGVVSGKDRYFFFFGYQGQRQVRTEALGNITTFSNSELNGDFSRSNNGSPDPGVAQFLQANPFFQSDPGLAARAIIDPARINSIANNYIKAGLIPSTVSGLFDPQSGAKNNSDEETLKLDFLFTPKDKLTVTLGASRNPLLLPFGNANEQGFEASTDVNHYFFNLAYIRTFTPTVLNELRLTAQRARTLQGVPAQKQPLASDLGINITPDRNTGPPALFFNSGLSVGFDLDGPTQIISNTYSIIDTLSWIKGKHTTKFGGGFTAFQNNTVFDFFINGQFSFDGNAGGIGTNNDKADFLLGLPDLYLQFPEAATNIRSKSFYFFGQDEWHIRNNFTLTYGLRYEYNQPKLDTAGRSFSLAIGQQSTVFPNAPLGLLFPGDKGAPTGANFSDKNDFAPRVGFAWDPFSKGKTSIRGGFGVFYDILKAEDNLQFNGQIPFFSSAFLFFNPLASNPTQEVNYLSQPFIAAGVPNPFPSRPADHNVNFADAGFLPFGGGGVFLVDPHLRTPYIYQFNLGIQQEIVRNLIVEVNYVGSSSHKLTSLVDVNPYSPGATVRMFNNQPGVEDGTFNFLDEFTNVASANYHSLEVSLQKQLSDSKIGTTYFTLAYTLAHNIDNASGFRQRNSQVPAFQPGLFRTSADTDVRQRIVFSGGWDLPLEKLFKSLPTRITKGWSLYPIISYRTGFPIDILAGFQQSFDPGPSGIGDADLVHANFLGSRIQTFNPHGSQTINGAAGNYYFNPNLFSIDGISGYGSLPRNAFRGPGQGNIDLAIAKTTPLFKEKLNMEFRAEFFNLINHAEFRNPDTNIFSDTFGQVTTTFDPRIIQFAVRLTF